MNKLMKMATVVVGVGAMLSFAGCGKEGNSSNVGKGGNQSSSPETVAVESLKAEMKAEGVDASSCTLKVAKSELNGDKGIIYIDIFSGGKKEITSEVNVHKEGKVWKAGKSKEAEELDAAARVAYENSSEAREKLGRPKYNDNWKPGDPMIQYEDKVAAKEKKGDSIFVTIESFANNKKYDTFVVEMKKVGTEWKPVYK